MPDVLHLVRQHAERNPSALAILAPGRAPLTYGALWRRIEDVVATLNSLGIGRNDRLALVLPEGADLAVALVAIGAGATCAPLNPLFRPGEFEFALKDMRAAALVVLAGSDSPAVETARHRGVPVIELSSAADDTAGTFALAGPARAREAPCGFAEPDDTLLVLHTSGTTARPRLVPLSHRNVAASARAIATVLELTDRDRCLNVMPLFHIHGMSALWASLAAGASVVCAPGFSARDFFDWLREFQPTWYTAAPAIHRIIFEEGWRRPADTPNSALRFIRSASSAMPQQLMVDMERLFGVPCIEAYGMTETAPQIASNRLPPHVRKLGSVGRAAGPEVAIMGEAGEVLSPGERGEVVVRGANVTRGYDGCDPGDRHAFTRGWFRTGDTGYLDADGDLYITGRRKEIINRGGEKISPREVDEALMAHPAVAEAVAFAVPHSTLGESVAAAVVLRDGSQAGEADLQRFAAARLAPFKLPQPIVIVDAIPKGRTGKPQRSALAAIFGLTGSMREIEPPRSAVEERICAILADVLGLERCGIHENFFHLGGHSLTATMAAARIAEEFGIDLRVQSIFEQPTAAGLADAFAAHLPGQQTQTIPRRSTDDPCPLSFAQQRLWFLDQMEPGNPAYNIQLSLHLSGTLNVAALEDGLSEIRRRHEMLRTTFAADDGVPHQVVAAATPLRLPVIDLTRTPSGGRLQEARRLAAEQAGESFHLARGPLFRAVLARLGTSEHVLVLTMHHIVSDGWSNAVLARELGKLYGAFAAGQASPLPELPIQYADFAVWQRRWVDESPEIETQLRYWKEQLRGAPPVLDLAPDRGRPALQTYRGAKHAMLVPLDLADRLKSLAEAEGATLFMASLAVFQALLSRHTGREDLVVGTPIANRRHAATEKLVGFFANTLVMRADLSGKPSFRSFLARVREAALGAYANQDLPFEKLVDELQPARHPDRTPLFQVMFAFQNHPEPPRKFADGLTTQILQTDNETSKFDLTLYLVPGPRGLEGTWQYNTDLFDPATIAQMADHFTAFAEAAAGDPDRPLSELPLPVGSEQRRVLPPAREHEVSATRDGCFHELFEARAACASDAIAVQCAGASLSYRTLSARAQALALRLRGLGVKPETRVGVCLARSADMPVALLGVLKAGGAYVPLDPDYPADRLAFILRESNAPVIVTDARLQSRLPRNEGRVVCMEEVSWTDGADRNEVSGVAPQNLAYVVYTSGSTGRPKGVMITHANVWHYVRAMQAVLGVTSRDRYLHTASFGFSSSIRQFLLPLSCGATVVLASTDEVRDPRLLFETIKRERVSVIDLVPSYWRIATRVLADLEARSREALLDNDLRLILSASEPLHSDLPRQWSRGFNHGARVVNMFGQTETTGIVTVYPVPPADDGPAKPLPVGRPIAGMQVHVLDAARNPVPLGSTGEVFISGPGVGRGYLDQAATAEHFVPDPSGEPGAARLYRTGDLGRLRTDGNLELLGRVDEQLKVRGFRIEPGEIEAALNAQAEVLESIVVAQDVDTGGKRLVAYIVGRGGEASPALEKKLREALRRNLPDYMIPSAFVALPALPRTPSGKVDRRALPACKAPTAESGEPATAPGVTPAAEQILSEIWSDLLQLPRVGIKDNFFDLGGDSLMGVQMIERANRAGLGLSPRQLFQYQTIAELARVARGHGPGAMAPREEAPETAPPAFVAPAPSEPSAIRVTLDSLRAFGREALERAGLSAADAATMTEVQIEASLRGQSTHNVGAIPRYSRRLASGATNPQPRIRIERETATSALVDGDNGPGQLVAMTAMELAIRKARESGVCVVGARHSNHFGAAGHYAWLAATKNLIGLCTTNSALWLAPTGGLTPLFGTNPLAIGIPSASHYPIVLDISMSVQAKGKVALHLAGGNPLPPGWILDGSGRPSIDPADLAAGLGVPIGGHKGYGLAFVLEVLSGVLTGAGFGEDHRRERMRRPDLAVDFGHFFMAIDPTLFMPLADFTARVDRMISQVRAARRAEHVSEILLPGEMEMRSRERNLAVGVPVLADAWRALQEHKVAAGLGTELVVVPPNLPFTRADIEQTIPARFEHVARHFPERVALRGDGRCWTYRDLNAAANRLAHAILERTSRGPGAVAYVLGQSPEMVIATLAVLKAGKTYLAIHPRMPHRGQAEVVKDIAPDLILTMAGLESRARELADGVCGVLALEEIDARYAETDPPNVNQPGDASTIFYTSGTTGQAKGVVKSHRAVLHRVWLSTKYDAITPADRQSLLTHCSFSASESDMFCALLLGASVHVFDIVSGGLSAFRTWLEEERVTLLHPPVLFFRRFLATLDEGTVLPWVRIVALAGDVVLPTDLQSCRRHFQDSCVILHRFSITETALLTVARIDHGTVIDPEVVDAGKPVPDKTLVLVNEVGEPVPPGEIGELVVRSAFLADGYWQRPTETAAAFTAETGESGERAYHTGDLGRFLDDGRFVFLGRRDHQVKIRGYRVDIREVEAALLELDDVAESAVVVRRERGEPRLVAFLVLAPGAQLDPKSLRTRLRSLLPEWKIPACFEALGSLPTTANGKVDRQRLAEARG